MNEEQRGRSSYLDLLITTLMEHEKNLDAAIAELEKICEKILAAYEEAALKTRKSVVQKEKGRREEPDSDTLVYMKIKTARPVEETLKIIESLKE